MDASLFVQINGAQNLLEIDKGIFRILAGGDVKEIFGRKSFPPPPPKSAKYLNGTLVDTVLLFCLSEGKGTQGIEYTVSLGDELLTPRPPPPPPT